MTAAPGVRQGQPAASQPAIAASANLSKQKKKLQALEQRIHQYMDREDQRVKEVTERILYNFLPALLTYLVPPSWGPLEELSPHACTQAASAVLAVSCLLNAPPGFLEFLLCVPWQKLNLLHPSSKWDAMLPSLLVSSEERREIINTPIPSALLPCVLAFLYLDENEPSLPPVFVLSSDAEGAVQPAAVVVPPTEGTGLCTKHGQVHFSGPMTALLTTSITTEVTAAVLDGATPLFCAALRGNPAQVDHLLYCGADPCIPNAAGDLPLEMVPLCGDRTGGSGRVCRCMSATDEQVWECRSRLTRQMIMRASVMSLRGGLRGWLRRVAKVSVCWLGVCGLHPSVLRPSVRLHMLARQAGDAASAQRHAESQVAHVRASHARGAALLSKVREQLLFLTSRSDPVLPQPAADRPPPNGPGGAPTRLFVQLPRDAATCAAYAEAFENADGAVAALLSAVQTILRLTAARDAVRCEGHGRPLPTSCCGADSPGGGQLGGGGIATQLDGSAFAPPPPQALLRASECAEIVRDWSESVLLKIRLCSCPGCSVVAMQSIGMAHSVALEMYDSLGAAQPSAEEKRAVGQCLLSCVQAHIVLLLTMQVHASPSKERLYVANACVDDWSALDAAGLSGHLSKADHDRVALLRKWIASARGDLVLAEALNGEPLDVRQEVADVLTACITGLGGPCPRLARPVAPAALSQLQSALTAAPDASPRMRAVCAAVVQAAHAELELLERLRAAGSAVCRDTELEVKLVELQATVDAAAAYPHLAAERDAAIAASEELRGRLELQQRLEAVMAEAREVEPQGRDGDRAPHQVLFDVDWSARIKKLQEVVRHSEGLNPVTNRAKRLVRELQAYANSAAAVRQLEEVMARVPCGTSALKTALKRLEEAGSVLAGSGGMVTLPGAVLFAGLVGEARQRLELEKAAEALAREARTAKSVDQLPRLEAAILAAKRVGAENLDPESYSLASEARERLAQAFRLKAQLELSMRAIDRAQRQEEADSLDAAIASASEHPELLTDTIRAAREKLSQWRSQTASEAKLQRALHEGATAQQLSRAIQEAAAAGVKVAAAKRSLKLLQSLEAALALLNSPAEPAPKAAALASKVAAAEVAGVTSPLLRVARLKLRSLLIAEVQQKLDAALKPHSDWPITLTSSSLKAALQAAQDLLADARMAQYLRAEATLSPDNAVPLLQLLDGNAIAYSTAAPSSPEANSAPENALPGPAPDGPFDGLQHVDGPWSTASSSGNAIAATADAPHGGSPQAPAPQRPPRNPGDGCAQPRGAATARGHSGDALEGERPPLSGWPSADNASRGAPIDSSDECAHASCGAEEGTLRTESFDPRTLDPREAAEALDDGAARRKGLETGWLAAVDLDQEELLSLTEGVEPALLRTLCEQLDALVVATGRALAMHGHVLSIIEHAEAQKANEVRSKKEALARAEALRKEREDAERRSRDRLEAEKRAEKDRARNTRDKKAKAAGGLATRSVFERRDAPGAGAAPPREPPLAVQPILHFIAPQLCELGTQVAASSAFASHTPCDPLLGGGNSLPFRSPQPLGPFGASLSSFQAPPLACMEQGSGPRGSRASLSLLPAERASVMSSVGSFFGRTTSEGEPPSLTLAYSGQLPAASPRSALPNFASLDDAWVQHSPSDHAGFHQYSRQSTDNKSSTRYDAGAVDWHSSTAAPRPEGPFGGAELDELRARWGNPARSSELTEPLLPPTSTGFIGLGVSSIWAADAPPPRPEAASLVDRGNIWGGALGAYGALRRGELLPGCSADVEARDPAAASGSLLAFGAPGSQVFGGVGTEWTPPPAATQRDSRQAAAGGARAAGLALGGAVPGTAVGEALSQAVENMRNRNSLNVHAAEFQIRRQPDGIDLPQDL